MATAIGSTLGAVKQTFWEVWGEPALTATGLYEPQDRTYGRYAIPFSPMEQRLHANADVTVWFGKAMMPNGKDFTWYQVWEDHAAQKRTGRKADILFVHGTGVHGGTLASHSRRYLDAGFRVIVPDLPSHGYSTGVHVFQHEIRGYTSGLHAVLHDIGARDDNLYNNGELLLKSQRRDCFLLGLSFGGLVALSYALHYPTSLRSAEADDWEMPVDGIVAVGPMIGYSVQNCSISPTAEKLISMANHYLHLSRLELVVPHKKCLDKDPKVYKTLVTEDKRSHQGAFRIGHLAALHYGMIELRKRAHEIVHPIFVQQGGQDRVVDFNYCVDFVRDINSTDKRCVVYPVCQHVIYRKAKTEEEDQAGRVACIEDNVEWMCERSRVPTMHRQLSAISMQSDVTMYDEGVPIHPLAMGEDGFNKRNPLSSALLTPIQPSTPSFPQTSEAFFDPSKPIPTYAESESGDSDDSNEEDNAHPLLAKAHPTTLPLLAKIAAERAYRANWSLHEQLRPYDISCEHKKK